MNSTHSTPRGEFSLLAVAGISNDKFLTSKTELLDAQGGDVDARMEQLFSGDPTVRPSWWNETTKASIKAGQNALYLKPPHGTPLLYMVRAASQKSPNLSSTNTARNTAPESRARTVSANATETKTTSKGNADKFQKMALGSGPLICDLAESETGQNVGDHPTPVRLKLVE